MIEEHIRSKLAIKCTQLSRMSVEDHNFFVNTSCELPDRSTWP